MIRMLLTAMIALLLPLPGDAQFGIVCKNEKMATALFKTFVEASKPWIRLNTPVTVPGLDENFGLARLHKCKMDGMLSAELVGPVEVDCNPERILLGLTVGLNETVLFCDLTLGMAPALAFHTKLSFSFDRLDVKATLQLPRDKKSTVKVAILKADAKSVINPGLNLVGLEPMTSVVSQMATIGLRAMPSFTRAFFSAFLSVEAPKILSKMSTPL